MRELLAGLAALLLIAPSAAATPELVRVGDFHAPVGIASPPGSTDLYVVDQDGKVIRYDEATGARSTFVDVVATTGQGYEQGVLSIAFDAQWATTGRFWIFQTRRSDDAIVILRGHRDAPQALTPILVIPHTQGDNHNGGDLHVGPDGFLYASVGDGGTQGDPEGDARSTSSLLGKILRIDPATGDPVAGNPFSNEVWHFGLRNPYRFAFDRETGDMLIGDVGGGTAEEVSFIAAGAGGRDLGWACREGTSDGPADCEPTASYTPPAIVLPHGQGYGSVIGGRVVRDPQVPSLLGRYVYGDHFKTTLRAATVTASGAEGDADIPGIELEGNPLTFGEDACGRVYVGVQTGAGASHTDGAVYRLQEAGQPSVCAPGGGGPAADVQGCSITATATSQRLRGRPRRIRVRVGADEPCTLTVRARVKGIGRDGRALRFRPRTVDVAAGQSRTVRLRAGRSATRRLRTALRRRGRVRVRVAVAGRDAAGNRSAAKTRFRLRR